MRNIVLIIFISLAVISCKVTEKPEFVEIKSLDIIDTSSGNFTIQADVAFKNKNQVGGTLQVNNIHVFIDSVAVASVQSEVFEVPKESEFVIPLTVIVPFENVFSENEQNLLYKIISVIGDKKVMMQYKGEIRYKLGAFHYDYPIAVEQEINFKKYFGIDK